MSTTASQAFLVMGIVFLVLGFSSHTAYVGIGSAFIAMALFGRKTKKNRNDGNR